MMGTEARPKACAACGKRGVDLEVHHLVPRAVGGEAGPTCLLCRQCHDAVHQTDRGSVSGRRPCLPGTPRPAIWTHCNHRRRVWRRRPR